MLCLMGHSRCGRVHLRTAQAVAQARSLCLDKLASRVLRRARSTTRGSGMPRRARCRRRVLVRLLLVSDGCGGSVVPQASTYMNAVAFAGWSG